jgi:hypothetical protein
MYTILCNRQFFNWLFINCGQMRCFSMLACLGRMLPGRTRRFQTTSVYTADRLGFNSHLETISVVQSDRPKNAYLNPLPNSEARLMIRIRPGAAKPHRERVPTGPPDRHRQAARAGHPWMWPMQLFLSILIAFPTCSQHSLRIPALISGNLYSKRYFPVMGGSSPLSHRGCSRVMGITYHKHRVMGITYHRHVCDMLYP